MGTGAHVTSTGAHPQYERCPPAIITGANTYKYSADDMQESSSVHVHGMRGLIALQHNRTDMIELPDGCRIIIPRFIRLIKGVDHLPDLP